jgi:hypothetical protein
MGKLLLGILGCSLAVSAGAQQASRSDPRIEQLLNQNVIVAMNRSVSLEKAVPLPPAGERLKPRVTDPDLVRLDDALYIDRRLLPPARSAPVDDGGAVRVFPRDNR